MRRAKKPNILFIIIDALRARNLGCYAYSKPTSPYIDSLAKEGVLFENAFSCAASTYPSLATIFSGKYPLSHGVIKVAPTRLVHRNVQKLNETRTVFLPEVLRLTGYTTLAVDWLGRWNKRGYDYYSGLLGRRRLKLLLLIQKLTVESIRTKFMLGIQNFLNLHKIDAKTVTNKAVNLINKYRDKEFFLFVHYWDVHAPYNPPTNYIQKFNRYDYDDNKSVKEVLGSLKTKQRFYVQKYVMRGVKSINEVLARYDASIAYVDHEVERLIATLERNRIEEDTFIILTSDHGESLGEHGIYFSHHGLYDVTIHVPFILKYGDFLEKKRIIGLVQHVDITPTLLDVLGMEDGALSLDGRSLIPMIFGKLNEIRQEVFCEEADTEWKRAVRTDNYKYIKAVSPKDAICQECDQVHGGIEELYDMNKDPRENNNIIGKNLNMAKILKEKLSTWVRSLEYKKKNKGLQGRTQAEVYSPEEEKMIVERLKKLGYV